MVPTSSSPSTSSSVRQRSPLVTWLGIRSPQRPSTQSNKFSLKPPSWYIPNPMPQPQLWLTLQIVQFEPYYSSTSITAGVRSRTSPGSCVQQRRGTALSIKNCSLSTWLSSTFVILSKAVSFWFLNDHKPLTFALSTHSDKYTPRQTCHLDFISQFTADIRHVSGGANPVADTLSQAPVDTLHVTQTPAIDFKAMAKAQSTDPELRALCNSSTSSLQLETVPHLALTTALICDMSTGNPRPFVPGDFRRDVFNSLHSLSHPGIRATQ